MENETVNIDVLQLEGLKVSPESSIPVFILFLLIYIFIMVSNIGLVVLIFTEKSLHQPMYLLFCNMSINDVLGATTVIPRLLSDIFVPGTNRSIHYIDCVIQAFCSHLHGATSHTVLMIMAVDRYVAICNPLRYTTIMTKRMVVKLSVSAWAVTFVLIAITVGLSVRLSRCRRVVFNPFCDNPSLFKLSCENLIINHIYGLITAMGTLFVSLCSVMLTYMRIAMVCLSSKNKALNSKALQTCATHLVVYIILLVSGAIIIILHRFSRLSDHRKLASILFHVVPPAMNTVIYGVQIKAVRQKIFIIFTRNTMNVTRANRSEVTGQTNSSSSPPDDRNKNEEDYVARTGVTGAHTLEAHLVYSKVLQRRIRPIVEPWIQEDHPGRGTLDQLYTL
ncbi:olfactory receptor 5B17-like [Chelmon rostratus]|uniref:olfactory receptor 5B17-like n=1 Tax=Chelmon rostratus TaxID=109905 RepID=UPI001BED0F0D|nr:olfactory receptor 5B17-like [Chelmon rostratus]